MCRIMEEFLEGYVAKFNIYGKREGGGQGCHPVLETITREFDSLGWHKASLMAEDFKKVMESYGSRIYGENYEGVSLIDLSRSKEVPIEA